MSEGRPSPLSIWETALRVPQILFAPDRGMEAQAAVGRARYYFLFAWVTALLLGFATAHRLDARSTTLRKLDESGQLQGMSDRQISEETAKAERIAEVISVAKGAVATPLQLGTGCLAIAALSWFLRGKLKGSALVPVAGAALLPGALANLLDAGTVFQHAVVPPDAAVTAPRTLTALLPLVGPSLHGPFAKLGDAFDVFSLWTAVLLAFALAAAAHLRKRTALVTTLVAWVCYRLLTHVAAG